MQDQIQALFDLELQNAAHKILTAPGDPAARTVIHTRTCAQKTPCQDSTAVLEVDEMPALLPRYTDGNESDNKDDDENETPIL